MGKKFNNYLWYIAGIFFLIYVAQQIFWLPGFSLFKNAPVKIDGTPVLIKEIRNISELVGVTMYDEATEDSAKEKNLPSFPGLRPDPDRLVLIGRGSVMAGMDLKGISAGDIQIRNDTLLLKLPPPKILQVIVNPSDFEIFDEAGNWSDEAVQAVKIRIRNKITNRAISDSILERSRVRCNAVMSNFLRMLGYKNVLIRNI